MNLNKIKKLKRTYKISELSTLLKEVLPSYTETPKVMVINQKCTKLQT